MVQVAFAASSASQESAVETRVRELEVTLVEAHEVKKKAAEKASLAEAAQGAALQDLVADKSTREEADRRAATVLEQLRQGALGAWSAVKGMSEALPSIGINVGPLLHDRGDLAESIG